MNIKELVLIVCLALLATWGIEYLFFNKKAGPDGIKSGQSFEVPKGQQELLKPLNTEIDFLDAKRSNPATLTPVETDYARLIFSTDGACLQRLEFKRELDGQQRIITTIFPLGEHEREKQCFLVALPEKTPFYYTLSKKTDTDDAVELTYEASTDAVAVKKTYTVFKHSYKIGLTLTVQPIKESSDLQARIFFPAPLMPDIAASDIKSAIIGDDRGTLTKIPNTKILDRGWYAPTLVGVDNRYFVHAMVDDPAQFTQRAYYKLSGVKELFAVLESPVITQEHSWTLSFYFGPKEGKALAAVDPRLEQTLEYSGWFAPISKLLLKILNFFFNYLHNYGLAIIALTVLIKLLLLPLTIKSTQSLKKTTEMQRKLQYLQQKYRNDPELLARERAELIRTHGMPGMAGCLPILIQIPIFIGLSRILSSSIELYKAPFTFWITDLSAADPCYILPVLIAASMLLQALTVDAKQRTQFIVMALVFGALSVNFSAGLSLYIFMSTFLGVLQSYIQNKLSPA